MRISEGILAFIFLLSVNIFSQQGGYTNSLSVQNGDVLNFYISTSASQYQIRIYKLGLNAGLVYTSPNIQGGVRSIPNNASSNGCNWQLSYSMTVPSNWEPGVYSAEFPVGSGNSQNNGTIIFTVKNPLPGTYSKLLVVLSTNTMQAYNNYGGKSLYDFNSTAGRASQVSFLRPYTADAIDDYYSRISYLVDWLALNNLTAEYCVDNDLDKFPNLLNNYSAVVYAGHDEYWSLEERTQAENYVAGGGKLILLSGNTMWWQVRFTNNNQTMICYKDKNLDPLTSVDNTRVTVNWYDSPVNNPENSITGVSFRFGGYVNDGNNLPASQGYGDYTAYNTQSWVFDGTGLEEGDPVGTVVPVVGYEADGAVFNWQNGIPVVNGIGGTPLNFRILGLSPAVTDNPNIATNTHATMGIYTNTNGGAVFNASTTDWVRGLDSDQVVQKITYNVINKFLQNRIPPEIVSWLPNNVSSANIHNENVFVSNRNITLTGDSLNFSVAAEDPYNNTLGYFWTVDGAVVSHQQSFTYYNNSSSGVKTVAAYVYNLKDTSSISWNLTTVNNNPVFTLSGKVIYDNKSGTSFSQTEVLLIPTAGGDTLSVMTDSSGNFSFSGIFAGSYNLSAQVTKLFPVNSVNGTDALLILKTFVGQLTLSGLKVNSADVNNDQQVNAGDALFVVKRFVGTINSFPKGNWISETDHITITNQNLTGLKINVIATGDVDDSAAGAY